MVNSKIIRPEIDGIDSNGNINTIRVSRVMSKSSFNSVSTAGSYYLSFADKDKSFLQKMCPYLLGLEIENTTVKTKKCANPGKQTEETSGDYAKVS